MSKHIYSTLTNSCNFALWSKPKNGIPLRTKTVFIQGGANVPNDQFVTPKGVVTKVSDEDYDALLKCPSFVLAVSDGYLSVETREKKLEKVVADMEPKDSSAPLTAEDYAPGKAPIVGGDESEPEPAPRRRGRPPKVA